jgi:hypothetical protein
MAHGHRFTTKLMTYYKSVLPVGILASPEFRDSLVRIHGEIHTQELVGICFIFVVRYWWSMGVVEIALQDSFAKKKKRIARCPRLIPVKTMYISPMHAIRDRDLRRKLHRRRRHSPSYLTRARYEVEESLRCFDNNEVPNLDALDTGVSETFTPNLWPAILTSNLALKWNGRVFFFSMTGPPVVIVFIARRSLLSFGYDKLIDS